MTGESASRSVHGAKLAVWLLGRGSASTEQRPQGWADPTGKQRARLSHSCAVEPSDRTSSKQGAFYHAEKPAGKGFAAVEAILEAAAAAEFGGDPALAALAKVGDLIEQYLHPSNNGQCASCTRSQPYAGRS